VGGNRRRHDTARVLCRGAHDREGTTQGRESCHVLISVRFTCGGQSWGGEELGGKFDKEQDGSRALRKILAGVACGAVHF